ncbi:hypothetical protein L873DRAFT_1762391, partial [Choiromyces venosus 120613-1]
MTDLGHQLEEEIAEKEVWQELTHKLQNVDLIHNATGKRKLSEARVLDGAALIKLRDAQLEKDEKRAVMALSRKAASEVSGGPRKAIIPSLPIAKPATASQVIQKTTRKKIHITEAINRIPKKLVQDSGSGSEIEEISDEEWGLPPPTKLAGKQIKPRNSKAQFKQTSQLLPDH